MRRGRYGRVGKVGEGRVGGGAEWVVPHLNERRQLLNHDHKYDEHAPFCYHEKDLSPDTGVVNTESG